MVCPIQQLRHCLLEKAMSRRKDRERVDSMKRLDPDYQGFRGYDIEPRLGRPILEPVACTVCGRTRNVPKGSVDDGRDTYVCTNCRDEG